MRKACRVAAVITTLTVGAAFLAGCDFGTTGSASDVLDTSAKLSGVVRNTVAEPTTYWFEYGPTTEYGQSTTHRVVNVTNASSGYAVKDTVGGLLEATSYHYRLCTAGADAQPTCASDATFTTTTGRDSVSGFGTVLDLGFGYVIGASVFATSAPDGAAPITGHATSAPGSVYFKVADGGNVTCVRVDGNRATIGFDSFVDLGQPDPHPISRLIFIEDNGPTGDRLGLAGAAETPTTCPVPTAADFPDFTVGGVPIPPLITVGDFTIHDHLEP